MIKNFLRVFFVRYDDTRAKLNTVYRLTVYGDNSLYLFEQKSGGKLCHSTNFYDETLMKIRRKELIFDDSLCN